MNKIEMAGCLTGYDLVIRKGQANTFSEILFKAPFLSYEDIRDDTDTEGRLFLS